MPLQRCRILLLSLAGSERQFALKVGVKDLHTTWEAFCPALLIGQSRNLVIHEVVMKTHLTNIKGYVY